jgi:hypothetical protein
MLRVPEGTGIRYHDRGDYPQPRDDLSRLIEPTHMGVARSEIAIRAREAWILLDRQEQLRLGFIEASC